ncbi:hypothetical protein NZD89_20320 [Alicyclobacillus fastidiosus]|uniref:Uncharacterized protein n=1 Tax=Alicyclobacillus fastidiosus TaxID=392011 RepID=A0ABY6ZCL5_9BACL|nr:hypothetical protein [Alicyclobacillus fastidiosus]WAH40635.1 hypothetical protein NZD89_20320 [Alicyclobacillus fastidiosus]
MKRLILSLIIFYAILVVNHNENAVQHTGKLHIGDSIFYSREKCKQRAEHNDTVQPGDILLYRSLRNRNTKLIKFFERCEDGPQVRGYYHVAIALDSQLKIESNGKRVTIEPINYGMFDVFRPSIPSQQRNAAINYLKGFYGQPYDWWLVTDDLLRYFTHNVIHLPVSFVQIEERNKKTCSSLVSQYFSVAKWGPALSQNVSPEDIYRYLKNYQVTDV